MSEPVMPDGVRLRQATTADVPALMGLMDVAIAWLAARGATGQWGDGRESVSASPARVAQFTRFASSGGCWIAESAGRTDGNEPEGMVVGAVCVGPDHPDYAPPPSEPEMYVQLLITHRAWQGRGLGTELVAKARALAVAAEVRLLRVDCYAGGNGGLVRWYESVGFRKAQTFVAKEGTWPGQVLYMWLDEREDTN